MPDAADEVAMVGFELRTLLRRIDRLGAANTAMLADPDPLDDDSSAGVERDLRHDAALAAHDAVLVCALRLVRFFVLPGSRRHPDERDPSVIVPGWTAPDSAAERLLELLDGMSVQATQVTLGNRDWPFALILATLLDVAEDFSWALGAYSPEAAQHFDHNLIELRERLR